MKGLMSDYGGKWDFPGLSCVPFLLPQPSSEYCLPPCLPKYTLPCQVAWGPNWWGWGETRILMVLPYLYLGLY